MLKHRSVRLSGGAALLTPIGALGAALGLAAALTDPATASSAEQGVVYSANEHGKSVSAIDLATGRTATVEVAIAPHNVQALADGSLLLATGSPAAAGHGHGSGHEQGRLLVLDTDRLAAGPIARSSPKGSTVSRSRATGRSSARPWPRACGAIWSCRG